jgi:phosphatidate cytidylyltransferase
VKRVLTAAILIPLVILALFKAPPWLFTLLVLAVALLAGNEYLDIVTATGLKPFRALSYLFLLCLFVACEAFVATVNGSQVPVYVLAGSSIAAALALLVVLASPFVYMIASMRREPLSAALADASASFFLLPYVGLTLFGLPMLRSYENGAIFILFMMLTVWVGDLRRLGVRQAQARTANQSGQVVGRLGRVGHRSRCGRDPAVPLPNPDLAWTPQHSLGFGFGLHLLHAFPGQRDA